MELFKKKLELLKFFQNLQILIAFPQTNKVFFRNYGICYATILILVVTICDAAIADCNFQLNFFLEVKRVSSFLNFKLG